jgi:hypothetical protein
MENIVRNVRDIEADDRHALEHVVGQTLRENQRLIIQIAEVDVSAEAGPTGNNDQQTLDQWTSVYDGLSDEAVEAIDKSIKERANLTRPS